MSTPSQKPSMDPTANPAEASHAAVDRATGPSYGLEQSFEEYFDAIERSGSDRCFLCRRTSAEVKHFFGFGEDGLPREAAAHGLEDVVLESADIMSYRGERPICAVCQLNFDTIFLLEEHGALTRVIGQMEHERDKLWPPSHRPGTSAG